MDHDEIVDRTVGIIRDLYNLKEDVLFGGGGIQPWFDAGMLEAALTILRANVDDDDPCVRAEQQRQNNERLKRAINGVANAQTP